MRKSGREIAIAVLACAAAMLCFSVVRVFLRHLTKHLDCWTVNAVRYSTAAPFWLPFVLRLTGKAFGWARWRPPRPGPAVQGTQSFPVPAEHLAGGLDPRGGEPRRPGRLGGVVVVAGGAPW